MTFFDPHKKALLSSSKLFNKRFAHVLVADISSVLAVGLFLILIFHTIFATINTLKPLAEDIYAYAEGSVSEEQLTESILQKETLINNVIFEAILLVIVGFFVLNGLLSLFRGIAWSLLKEHHFGLGEFWTLFKIHLLYSAALLVLAVIISFTAQKSVEVAAILTVLFLAIVLHFTPLVYSAFNPKKGVLYSMKEIYRLGVLNIQHYITFYVLSLFIICAALLLLYLLRLIHPLLSSISFIIMIYLYWLWSRKHHIHLAREL